MRYTSARSNEISWRTVCLGCGEGYEAKKETSKYCGGTCRQRVFRNKRRERLEKQSRMEVDPIENDLVAYGFSPAQIARLRRMAMNHYDTVKIAIARYDHTGWILQTRKKEPGKTDAPPGVYVGMANNIRQVVRERLDAAVPRRELAAALQENEHLDAAALLNRVRCLVKAATRKGEWKDQRSDGQKTKDDARAASVTVPADVTL